MMPKWIKQLWIDLLVEIVSVTACANVFSTDFFDPFKKDLTFLIIVFACLLDYGFTLFAFNG